jgi:hypothetical protein
MFVRCSNSSSDILAAATKHTQTVIDVTLKETDIDQQQHNCETLICQRHQTILWFLSSAAMVCTQWRVRELYCLTTNVLCERITYTHNQSAINISYFTCTYV